MKDYPPPSRFRVIGIRADGTSSTLMVNLPASIAEGLAASLTERFPDTKFAVEHDAAKRKRLSGANVARLGVP
jgi:hypothetical protein